MPMVRRGVYSASTTKKQEQNMLIITHDNHETFLRNAWKSELVKKLHFLIFSIEFLNYCIRKHTRIQSFV